MLLYRLNYALDMRYGVLLEIGKSVFNQEPIDLSMGYANVIWQGDANEYAIRSLLHCESPAKKIKCYWPRNDFNKMVGRGIRKIIRTRPTFKNQPAKTALLNNSSHAYELLGKPSIALKI